jgi:3-phytase
MNLNLKRSILTGSIYGALLASAGGALFILNQPIRAFDRASDRSVAVTEIKPVVETDPLPVDVDDPSIWVNPKDAGQSLIVGTVKRPKPDGGLAVYNLEGKLLERIGDLDRPNNVDIVGDICVTTERIARQLVIYRVQAAAPYLKRLGTVPVFEGQAGESGAPMGIALYQRKDGALFALVSRKTGPTTGYLWEYRLHVDGDQASGSSGKSMGEKVRELGSFSGKGEIEAVAVDQEAGLVYYSDEDCCVHVWRADPAAKDAGREVARFATAGWRANHEGIAVTGKYLIVTDQLDPRSEYHVFPRRAKPSSSLKEIAIWRGEAQSTDGIDAIARPMGSRFPRGFLVVMNNAKHNFQLYSLP